MPPPPRSVESLKSINTSSVAGAQPLIARQPVPTTPRVSPDVYDAATAVVNYSKEQQEQEQERAAVSEPAERKTLRDRYDEAAGTIMFEELFVSGSISQEVSVLPKAGITATFRSLTGADIIAIGEATSRNNDSNIAAGRYAIYARLALALLRLGGKHYDRIDTNTAGRNVEELHKRVTQLSTMSAQVLDLLVLHNDWFNERIDKVINEDFSSLGNG